MPRFRIHIRVDGIHLEGLGKVIHLNGGAFTGRVVDAPNQADAIKLAISCVLAQLSENSSARNPPEQPPVVVVEAIEDALPSDRDIGFAFFAELSEA